MNKFGRSLPSSSRQKGVRVLPTPNLIALTKDGDYNIRDRRLCNVKSPTEDSDAANRKFVDGITLSLLTKIDKSSNDCVKLIESVVNDVRKNMENQMSNFVDGGKKYADSKDNQLRDDIKTLITTLTDANKTYIDSQDKQLRTDIKTLNEELLKLSQSFDTIYSVREADHMSLEERFHAIDAQIQTVKHQTIENLKPEFDQLEDMLKSTISMMVQTHLTTFTAELTNIKKKLSQLDTKVDSLERLKKV